MTTKTSQIEQRTKIGKRLRALRGPRPLEAQAEKIGISRQRLSEWEKGDVPEAFMSLVRLAETEMIDLNELLLGSNGR